MERVFRAEWFTSRPMRLPGYALDRERGQYHSRAFLRLGASQWGAKNIVITDVDLYAVPYDFVFGQAQLRGRAAVVSTYRLKNGFYGLRENGEVRERLVKEAVHEVAHMYGVGHCDDPGCVMSFSPGVEDVDRKGVYPCPKCMRGLP